LPSRSRRPLTFKSSECGLVFRRIWLRVIPPKSRDT
jgi:hypothetical protein